MKREEFLSRLNSEAAQLGIPQITGEILYDWLEAKIIIAPVKHGRIRDWSDKELERGRKILRLISLGVKNLGQIRFHLWLDDQNIPFFEFGPARNLSREFLPIKNQLFGKIHSAYPEVENQSANSFSAKSVLRKMGELDPCLEPWVKYDPEDLLDAYTLLRCGHSKHQLEKVMSCLRPKIEAHLIGAFEQIVPEIPSSILRAGFKIIPNQAFSQLIRLFHIDEMSKTIFKATETEFSLARRAVNASVILFRLIGLQKVSDSLRHPTWQTAMFVLLLHLIRRTKGTIFEFESEAFDFIEKVRAYQAKSMS